MTGIAAPGGRGQGPSRGRVVLHEAEPQDAEPQVPESQDAELHGAAPSSEKPRSGRTLLAAVLLSMWAPAATLAAFVMNPSSTQLVDFIRRTGEFAAVAVAYLVFRRGKAVGTSAEANAQRNRLANLVTAGALAVSGVAVFAVALSGAARPAPASGFPLGLVIALLGLVTNLWLWQRYRRSLSAAPDSLIAGQRDLFRAKTVVDAAVVTSLAGLTLAPGWAGMSHLDLGGAVVVGGYLLISAARTLRRNVGGAG